MSYGTLSTLDTLKSTFQTIAEFGEDHVFDSINALLEAHNKILQTMFSDIVDRTTDRNRRYGTTDTMVMTKGNEFSRPDAQKMLPGAVAGFPLELFEISLQWTKKYFQNATVAELAAQFVAARDADLRRQIQEVQRALFVPTNYVFDDYLVDHLQQFQLQVRALLNADSLGIPAGPNGELFNGASHTHYLGTGSFVQADLVSLLETVLEHYADGQALIYINRAQEAAIRGFANFVPYLNTGYVGSISSTQYPGRDLQAVPIYNRAIGQFNGAEVQIKPWIPASYVFAFLKNQPKTLCLRTRPGQGNGDLQLVADDERHPLRARSYEREFGIGVWNRTNGAVLFTGNSTYAAPSVATAA